MVSQVYIYITSGQSPTESQAYSWRLFLLTFYDTCSAANELSALLGKAWSRMATARFDTTQADTQQKLVVDLDDHPERDVEE